MVDNELSTIMGTNTQILTRTNDICIEGLLDDMYLL